MTMSKSRRDDRLPVLRSGDPLPCAPDLQQGQPRCWKTPKSREGKVPAQEYKDVLPHLNQLYALYQVLRWRRVTSAAPSISRPQETRIIFGADRKITEIRPIQRNDAHKLIEECMLAANVAAARFMQDHEIPSLYRVHDGPPAERLEKLKAFLGELGLIAAAWQVQGRPSPKGLSAPAGKHRAGARTIHLIQTVMLRSLSQAVYSAENKGHFGLNYEAYTHFTSPIRRYPDLLVHRAIRSVIRSKRDTKHVERAGAASMPKARIYPYDESDAGEAWRAVLDDRAPRRRGHP